MEDAVDQKTVTENAEQGPAPQAPQTSPAATQATEPSPAETLAAMDHEEIAQTVILTVRMRKMLFFAVKDAEVKVSQGDAVIEAARTDDDGQALFKLKPGEYTVASGDRSTAINLQQNATVKL